jgi:hypothetical protein
MMDKGFDGAVRVLLTTGQNNLTESCMGFCWTWDLPDTTAMLWAFLAWLLYHFIQFVNHTSQAFQN